MAMNKAALSDESLDQVTGGTILPYTPKSGDSWTKLETEFHVTAAQIRAWNNLPENSPVPIGKTLDIYY